MILTDSVQAMCERIWEAHDAGCSCLCDPPRLADCRALRDGLLDGLREIVDMSFDTLLQEELDAALAVIEKVRKI